MERYCIGRVWCRIVGIDDLEGEGYFVGEGMGGPPEGVRPAPGIYDDDDEGDGYDLRPGTVPTGPRGMPRPASVSIRGA